MNGASDEEALFICRDSSGEGSIYPLPACPIHAARLHLFVSLGFPDAKRKADMRGLNRDTKCIKEENMKKEDFTALGISEELAEKAAKASEEELKGFVPRSRMNEETQKRKNAEETLDSVKKELDGLKASAGDSEQMKAQIKTLQDELKEKESRYAGEIAEMKMTNAIRSGLGNSVQDADLVAGLLDRTKLILADDGKITGLDEQIKDLRETKPFLFKDGETYPDVHDKGEPSHGGGKKDTGDLFAEFMSGNE